MSEYQSSPSPPHYDNNSNSLGVNDDNLSSATPQILSGGGVDDINMDLSVDINTIVEDLPNTSIIPSMTKSHRKKSNKFNKNPTSNSNVSFAPGTKNNEKSNKLTGSTAANNSNSNSMESDETTTAAPIKMPHTGGNIQRSSGSSTNRKKKQKEEEVLFDEKDLYAPLPVNLKLYCKHAITGRYHHCKVLERRELHLESEKSKALKTLSMIGGNSHLPLALKQLDFSNHNYMYYVHYTEWDRRMDEWVSRDRLLLITQIGLIASAHKTQKTEAMLAKDENKLNTQNNNKDDSKDEKREESIEDDTEMKESADDITAAQMKRAMSGKSGGKGSKHNNNSGKSDLIAHLDGEHLDGHSGGHGNFSAEDIEAHEEATKVKNIDTIQLGKYRMETWYYSPLPPEYNQFSTLHFCEFCLNFFGYEAELKRHSSKCTIRHPPGNEIYRSEEQNVVIAAFEVDGAVEKIYSQNLCYLSKLFLDHKTLEYDCTPFLFYILCEVDMKTGFYHMVGYFSKEKISLTNYNLACILTLPCHQRKGYGKVLISLSYELSKIEEKVGSPEKPISDLGKLSYMSYWSSTLLKILSQRRFGGDQISIEDLSKITCITTEDIIECLKLLHILVWYKGKWVYSESTLRNIIKEREDKRLKAKEKEDPSAIFVSQIRPEKLSWTPFFLSKRARTISGFGV